MDSAVNFILIFSGLWAAAFCASRQFYVVETERNWTDAQGVCQTDYTDLATIENEEEMNAVKDLLQNKSESFWRKNENDKRNIWIGLNGKKSQNMSWSDGTPLSYTNWKYGEPNYGDDDHYCVELHSGNLTWNDERCYYENYFICYKKQTPLIVINENKSWREALRFCRQNHVDLVYIDSVEMQQWVEVVIKNASTDMWIGLRHTCTPDFWYWVIGHMICYTNWAPGNGTGVEDCGNVERTGAVLSESKKWVSLPETDHLPFICITTK